MTDIRQSKQWGKYLEALSWKNVGAAIGKKHIAVRIRDIPLLGSTIKVQRIDEISTKILTSIEKAVIDKKPLFIKIEPTNILSRDKENILTKSGYKLDTWPLSPTKTIHINLKNSEEELMKAFSKDTRQSIKKARKLKLKTKYINFKQENKKTNGLLIDFYELLKRTSKRGKFYAPKMKDLKAKVKAFGKDAYLILVNPALPGADRCLAGCLILIHDKKAYYVHAASTQKGQKLNASYLTLWETIKFVKNKSCTIFDLEGIYDERFIKITKKWVGFTVFKKKWGGKIVEYPGSYVKYYHPLIKVLFSLEKFIP